MMTTQKNDDILFKETFSDPRNTLAFIEPLLPPYVFRHLNQERARLLPHDVVGDALADQYVGLFFETSIGKRPVYLHLVLERDDATRELTSFNVFSFTMRFLEHWVEEHPDANAVPPVFGFVVKYEPEPRGNGGPFPHFSGLSSKFSPPKIPNGDVIGVRIPFEMDLSVVLADILGLKP